MLLGSFQVWSQTRITGKVTSGEDGTALPGVSILEKGTTNGTVTDVEGNYSINAGDSAMLVFSFVGFTTQEVPVGGKTTIDIVLAPDITALSEVVIVGYGQQEQKDVTGVVTAVNSENFNKGAIVSPDPLFLIIHKLTNNSWQESTLELPSAVNKDLLVIRTLKALMKVSRIT